MCIKLKSSKRSKRGRAAVLSAPDGAVLKIIWFCRCGRDICIKLKSSKRSKRGRAAVLSAPDGAVLKVIWFCRCGRGWNR